MFGLSKMVQLQKARVALRAGRLDEAWGILTAAELKDQRACQELREAIVDPLLDRAEEHLAAGRLRDALADVERAHEAGGNRDRTATLRERVLESMRRDRKDEMRERAALESVRRHLRDGDASAARERLEKVAEDASARSRLERDVERLEDQTASARAEVRERLERGEVVQALDRAARSLVTVAPASAAAREVLSEAARVAEKEIEDALVSGRIKRAEDLAHAVLPLRSAGFGEGCWEDTLNECRRAAKAIAAGDWAEARVATGHLAGFLAGASWVRECDETLRGVEEGVLELRRSPLASARTTPVGAGEGFGLTQTIPSPAIEARPGDRQAASPSPDAPALRGAAARRAVLWVDGVGSYLVLAQDRVTLGRAGSSARPDIALAADVEGIHAEIVRAGEDYFVVARGKVRVGGREVERHLLADGDKISLGRRAKLRFRLPTDLSPTAILELESGLRAGGDVRRVVLLERHLILGSGPAAHVQVRQAAGRIVLGVDGEGFRVKASEPLIVDGRARGTEETVPLGAGVEVGCVSFTITADNQGERGS